MSVLQKYSGSTRAVFQCTFTGWLACCRASTNRLNSSRTDNTSFSSIRIGVHEDVVAFNSISSSAGRRFGDNSSLKNISPTFGSIPGETRSIFVPRKGAKNV